MNYGYQDLSGVVGGASADVRSAFIRKVYSIFFVSLLVTVGVGAFSVLYLVETISTMLMPLFIVTIVVGIIMSFTRRIPGVNIGMLMLYSALQGAILGPILLMFERNSPGIAAQAGFLTVAVFGCLTLYVFTSKKDFSWLGGMLFMSLIALILAGIVMMFIGSAISSMIYSVIGVLIFSGYVLYDTSVIINHLGPQDTVSGAIELYLDFLNLFLFILRLLNSRR